MHIRKLTVVKKQIFLVRVFFLLASIVTIFIISWINREASYADIRCRLCHREFNRLINIGEYDYMQSLQLPSVIIGKPLDETLAFYRERHPWMCEDCLYSIAYASSEDYPLDHPAWKGFWDGFFREI